MNYAIVTKSRPKFNDPFLGFVVPHIIEVESEEPKQPEKGDFPSNDEIFVWSAYNQLVENFVDDEFFIISYKENDRPPDGSKDWCAFVANGKDAEVLGQNEYFHVIDSDLDLSNRKLLLPYKPQRRILLHSLATSRFYGPFEYDCRESDHLTYEVRIRPCPPLPGFDLKPDCVYSFPSNNFSTITSNGQTIFVGKLKDLANSDKEFVDFISDERLLKLGNDLLPSDQKLSKAEWDLYRSALIELSAANPSFDDQRRNRLIKLIDRLDLWTARRSELISEFFKTPSGNNHLNSYLDSNRRTVLEEAEKRFSKELDERYGDLENSRHQLVKEINEITEKKNQLETSTKLTSEQITTEKQVTLPQEIQSLEEQLQQLNLQVQQKTELLEQALDRLNLTNSVEDLQREEHRWKRNIEDLKKEQTQLNEIKASILQQINSNQDDLRNELRKLKPYIDVLNGIPPKPADTTITAILRPKLRDDKPVSAKELVEEVRRGLANYGRDYRFDQVANFLTSIHQNFLTVFAGLPGVGKTSLVTYLAQALGMDEYNFLSIPISRGLTSQRDFLGFYNPLNQSFQPSTTGLYDLLKRMQNTGEEAQTDVPIWVLLDEANLSPIEHYFSSFLGMCDDHGLKYVSTGEMRVDSKLTIPGSLRFLATVNYDSTTEPLSNRMIDRVPIIFLQSPDGNDILSTQSIPHSTKLLSYEDFNDLFSALNSDDLTEDEFSILGVILDVLQSSADLSRGLPIFVSQRKRDKIRRFCCTARDLMKGYDGNGPELRALDYAVAQYILPLINGSGEKYRNRLLALQKAVDQLDVSKACLKRILEVGRDEYDLYRFF